MVVRFLLSASRTSLGGFGYILGTCKALSENKQKLPRYGNIQGTEWMLGENYGRLLELRLGLWRLKHLNLVKLPGPTGASVQFTVQETEAANSRRRFGVEIC